MNKETKEKINIAFVAMRKIRPNSQYFIGLDYGSINWSDENSDSKKPTEKEFNDAVIEVKAEYDAKQYQRDRRYPKITDQMDMQYWDQVNGTTTWQDAIAKVKVDNPK